MRAMQSPSHMSQGGFLGIRGWIWGVAVLGFVSMLLFFSLTDQPDRNSAIDPAVPPVPPAPKPAGKPEPDLHPDSDPERTEFEVTASAPRNDLEAAVFQSDLTVILPSRAALGPISVEKYDDKGRPTGAPLKSGTEVQIPDPDLPGARIHFRVP